MDEWIYGCGVRFWGERELTQATTMGWGIGLTFGLFGLAVAVMGIRCLFTWDGMDRVLGLLLVPVGALTVLLGWTAISDAMCYSSL